MFFSWNAFLTVWLVACTQIGVTFGSVEHCEEGTMNASATDVLRGSTVTLSCSRNRNILRHVWYTDKIAIFHNRSEVKMSRGDSISDEVLMHTFGTQTFECKSASNGKRVTTLLICGIYINVGILPDQPKNVSCIQYGENGTMTCTWEEGSYTYFKTLYELQLTNGTANDTQILRKNSTYGSVDLVVKLDFESTYTAVVIASNKLGNVVSLPFQFTLSDIVKPHSPLGISVEFDGIDGTNCTIFWQDQQDTQLFRIRFRPINSNFWIMLENITAGRYYLHALKPDMEYEIQVSCRFFQTKGLWSDWSKPLQTEAAPFGPLDIWYLKKDVSSQMENITLFWKNMNPSRTRGKSHPCRVTFQALNQKSHQAIETHSTTQTVFSQVMPISDYRMSVYYYNSRGSSPPTYITTDLNISDLLPPSNLSAASVGNGSIFLAWAAPLVPSSPINGYIVEWAEPHQGRHWETHPNWLKIPAANCTIKIEPLKPYVCYHIHVFALYGNRAGKAISTTGDSSAKVPLTGPHINTTVRDGRILVFWTEIPEEQQLGCIVSYKIYKQKSPSLDTKIYDIPTAAQQPFSIKNVQTGVAYILWMTASTKAGEGPKGNEKTVLAFTDVPDWAPVVVLCMIGLSIMTCCAMYVRLQGFFSDHISGWYNKTVPDPANSSWAKNFTSVEHELSSYSSQFLNDLENSEEPETLQIEEVLLIKRQSSDFEEVLISERIEKMESRTWPTESFQEENPTMDKLDHHSLVSNTPAQHPSFFLYKKVISEEPNEGQVFSDYHVNTLEDTTVDYLPSTILPTITNSTDDNSEEEFSPFNIFPRTFLPQTFSLGGRLTLGAIKMDCNSFTH
ncbi:interleukin-12 receptor subunit beta-2 isoform X2 [Paroedura picta]|uniref:interleukin-12 receptor subunit beta-2 isoform X2 n=1 Tax=Paroedura picta TaxID=143630 RepID=UPI004057031A